MNFRSIVVQIPQILVVTIWCINFASADYSPKVQEAMELIVLLCVDDGGRRKIEVVTESDSGFALNMRVNQSERKIKFNRSEAHDLTEGLTKEINKATSETTNKAKKCITSYKDRMLTIMLDDFTTRFEEFESTDTAVTDARQKIKIRDKQLTKTNGPNIFGLFEPVMDAEGNEFYVLKYLGKYLLYTENEATLQLFLWCISILVAFFLWWIVISSREAGLFASLLYLPVILVITLWGLQAPYNIGISLGLSYEGAFALTVAVWSIFIGIYISRR